MMLGPMLDPSYYASRGDIWHCHWCADTQSTSLLKRTLHTDYYARNQTSKNALGY